MRSVRSSRLLVSVVLASALVACRSGSDGNPPGPAAAVAPAGWAAVGADPQSVVTGPRVHVTDASGRAVPGIDVSFVVSVGGGSVERAAAVTDLAGDAGCGRWTLGPARGLNTVVASVAGLAPVTFIAFGASRSPSIQLSLASDRSPLLLPGSGSISGGVVSTYSIASATAAVWTGTRSVPIPAHMQSVTQWQLDVGSALDGIGRGPAAVVVTVVDAFGSSADAVFPAMIDRPPRVIVTAPFRNALARPTLHIEARCEDDDPAGCAAIGVEAFGVTPGVISEGTTTLSKDVDLSPWGSVVPLHFYARDSAGQGTGDPTDADLIRVNVNADPSLAVLHELPGTVLDVLGSRVLFVDQRSEPSRLMIRDTTSGAEDVLEASYAVTVARAGKLSYVEPSFGRLTSTGAIYRSPASIVDWRGGSRVWSTAVAPLGSLSSGSEIWVAGDFAAYLTTSASPRNPGEDAATVLVRRDLAAGMDATVVDSVVSSVALASNGDVALTTAYVRAGLADVRIFRFRDGATLTLGTGSLRTSLNDGSRVATNGAVVMYPLMCRIVVHDGSSERFVGYWPGGTGPWAACDPRLDYAVADGWIAYTVKDAAGLAQVWREGAAGAIQATFQNADTSISALGPDGTLLYESAGRLYRVRAGTTVPEVIGSSLPESTLVYRDGKFLVLLGNMVLTLPP